MAESHGEISEVSRMTPTGDPEGGPGTADPTPLAEDTNQVADGEPKNYGDVNPDEPLAKRERTRRGPSGRLAP